MFLLSKFCSEFICLATKVWCGVSKLNTVTVHRSVTDLTKTFVLRLSALNYCLT